MRKARLLKPVDGLPYKVGDMVPVYMGRFGYVWHVWKTIITLPDDSIEFDGTEGQDR